jgi:predicted dehydrogenase
MRAAVIGAGQIAKQHLGALAKCNGVEVVGICDLSPVMAESAAERFSLGKWYTDYRRLLDEARPDSVHVVTPPATHFDIASDCLQAGAHVLVEKPITEELGQLDELVGIAALKGKWLVEDHNYLFNRQIQTMLAMLARGEFGEVRHVDIDFCVATAGGGGRQAKPAASQANGAVASPVGFVDDFLTHLCYLSRAFIGEHERVSTSRRVSQMGGRTIDNLQALVEGSSATARLGFSSDSQPDSFRVRVQGTRMSVEANLFETGLVRTELVRGPKPLVPIRNMLGRGRAEWGNAVLSLGRKLSGGPGPYEGLWELVRRFYESLPRGGEPPVSAEQIRSANRLYHDVLQGAVASCMC